MLLVLLLLSCCRNHQQGFDEDQAWDILGTNPDNTAGSINFSAPDGGQVALQFLADQRTAQGACVFGGPAIFTP